MNKPMIDPTPLEQMGRNVGSDEEKVYAYGISIHCCVDVNVIFCNTITIYLRCTLTMERGSKPRRRMNDVGIAE